MQITMIQEDNIVVIGGEGRYVDLTTMPAVIHAVQYNTATETGHIEYDELQPGETEMNVLIRNKGQFQRFQRYVDAWSADGPPPAEPLPAPIDPHEAIDNTYAQNKAYQALIDYMAEKEGRPSTDLLTDLKSRVLL